MIFYGEHSVIIEKSSSRRPNCKKCSRSDHLQENTDLEFVSVVEELKQSISQRSQDVDASEIPTKHFSRNNLALKANNI